MSLESLSDRDTTYSIMAPSTAGAPVDSESEEGVESGESERSEKRVDWASISQSRKTESQSTEDSDEVESEESEKSEKRVDWASVSKTKSQSSEDSDAWHSESEANWTLVEASFRNGRDIAQSQVLSEGLDPVAQSQDHLDAVSYSQVLNEGLDVGHNGGTTQRRASVTFSELGLASKGQKEMQKDTLSPFREQDEDGSLIQTELPASVMSLSPASPESATSETPNLVMSEAMPICKEYGFDPPRPTKVFGACSWNTLPLAVSSSLVQHHSNAGERDSHMCIPSNCPYL